MNKKLFKLSAFSVLLSAEVTQRLSCATAITKKKYVKIRHVIFTLPQRTSVHTNKTFAHYRTGTMNFSPKKSYTALWAVVTESSGRTRVILNH